MTKRRIKAYIDAGTYSPVVGSVAEFKAELDALAESIGCTPDTAQIFIKAEGLGDGDYSLDGYVWRLETDAEEAAREAEADATAQANLLRYQQEREARKLRPFLQLKAKYGA